MKIIKLTNTINALPTLEKVFNNHAECIYVVFTDLFLLLVCATVYISILLINI